MKKAQKPKVRCIMCADDNVPIRQLPEKGECSNCGATRYLFETTAPDPSR